MINRTLDRKGWWAYGEYLIKTKNSDMHKYNSTRVFDEGAVKELIKNIMNMIDFEFKNSMSLGDHINTRIKEFAGDALVLSNEQENEK